MTELNKHILILSKWYPNNNDIQLGVFVKQQALLLQKKFKISVIYVQSNDTISTDFKVQRSSHEGVFEQIIYFKKAKGLFGKLINLKRYKAAQKIGYANLQSQVDLVHVHVPIRPLFLALHLAKHKNIPFVVSEHWSGHLTGAFNKKNFIYKYFYVKLIKKAIKISCVSEFLKKEFISNTGIIPLVIPNLIEQYEPKVELDIKSTNQIKILSVNDYINSIKNITGLLKGFSIALKNNSNLHLTLIGGGPDENLILDTVKKLNLTKSNLTILGRKPHSVVLECMQNCDFYISNSNFETFGMTIAEALRAGKPVISKLCGGPNEFLNSKNSLIITSKKENQIEDTILKMSNTFQTYNSVNISKEIIEKYGSAIILKKLEKLYTI